MVLDKIINQSINSGVTSNFGPSAICWKCALSTNPTTPDKLCQLLWHNENDCFINGLFQNVKI